MSTPTKAKKQSSGRTTPKKLTTAAEWSKDAKGRPLTVPSGKTCLVSKPEGLKAFMVNGEIPNILLPILSAALDGEGVDEETIKELVGEDPGKLAELTGLADIATINCVLEPRVVPAPRFPEGHARVGEVIPPHERDDDNVLYVDYIEDMDKWFILRYVLAGQTDLESFREELAKSVAGVQPSEGVGETSQ